MDSIMPAYLITARYCLSIPPENIRKPLGFLMFPEGIDKQYRTVMGKYILEVNDRNTRERCETFSKLIIKSPERR